MERRNLYLLIERQPVTSRQDLDCQSFHSSRTVVLSVQVMQSSKCCGVCKASRACPEQVDQQPNRGTTEVTLVTAAKHAGGGEGSLVVRMTCRVEGSASSSPVGLGLVCWEKCYAPQWESWWGVKVEIFLTFFLPYCFLWFFLIHVIFCLCLSRGG